MYNRMKWKKIIKIIINYGRHRTMIKLKIISLTLINNEWIWMNKNFQRKKRGINKKLNKMFLKNKMNNKSNLF